MLSDRIRPNSEAAPWVIAEIKSLETLLILAESELIQALEFLQKNYDADYGGEETGYIPNEEMRIGTQIEETLQKLKKAKIK